MLTVVTGTGRCGTRWLASVLCAAGVKAGHEAVFTPEKVRHRHDIDVDVSWLASTLPNPCPTLTVAREPAGCIASLIDCGLFTDGDRYTRAVGRVIELTGDPFTDACAWWTHVNSRAGARWRLDQPDRLPSALAAVGIVADVDPEAPADPHPIGARTTELEWDDLPDEVLSVAATWGWQ